MSGPSDEIPVYVADVRRRRTREEKLAILAEARSAPVSRVARKHGLSTGLLFRWRKQFADKSGLGDAEGCAGFVPIALPAPGAPEPQARTRSSGIEIVLACGVRLMVGEGTDLALVKRIVAALNG